MKLFNSLKFRLTLILLCVALIPLVSLAAFQLNQFSNTITNSIKTQEIEIANTNANRMDSWISSKISQLTSILKANPGFSTMTIDKIDAVLVPILQSDSELEMVAALDKNGNAYDVKSNSYKDLSSKAYFKTVKETKKTYIGDIIVSNATGDRCIPIAIPILKDNDFNGIIFSVVKIKTFENYIGSIKIANTGYAYLLTKNGDYIYHPESERIGKSYTEYAKNKDMQEVFSKDILVNNENFIKYEDDGGIQKVGAYSTVSNTGWKVIVAAPSGEVYAEINNLRTVIFVLIFVVAIVIVAVSVLMASLIANPIKIISGHLNIMANADFTKETSPKLLKRKDELGLLSNSVEIMSKSIRSVLKNVIAETDDVKEIVKVSSTNLERLASGIEDVSATTEELSAGMEETAASAEQMNATSSEIEVAVESIAAKSQSGSVIVGEINNRAQKLKDNASVSRKTANDLRDEVDRDIRASIEQSKAVEKINGLTEAILQITSQTNLLSLNAAIEAARAGEAGKGFAVVAEEIRKLADDSKKTVTEIQDVTKVVVASVLSLTNSSEKALSFIDTTVIKDYETLVDIGEQYFRDAEAIQDMVTDFSATSEELSASIQSMTKAINEITVSNNEGAQGIQNIAGKASDIMQKAAEVETLMKENENITGQLVNAVQKFKI